MELKYKEIEKQNLRLLVANDTEPQDYINFLSQRFNVTLIKSNDVQNRKDIDLILFTGGEDVTPEMYGQKVGQYTSYNTKRDDKESNIFYKYRGYVPCLGICRGSQALTVWNGGTLIQHVSNHGKTHLINIKNVGVYPITSTHHQMMYPYSLEKSEWELIAHAEYFESNTYLNGDNEEFDLPKDFLEPEIVYYKNGKSLCIQGHPEMGSCDKKTRDICLNLIKNYLFNNKTFKIQEEEKSYETYIPREELQYDQIIGKSRRNIKIQSFDWKQFGNIITHGPDKNVKFADPINLIKGGTIQKNTLKNSLVTESDEKNIQDFFEKEFENELLEIKRIENEEKL